MRFVNLVKVMNDGVVKIQKYGNKYSKDMLEMKVKYTRNLTIVFWVFALITAMTMCINSFIQSFYYQPQTVFDDIKVCSYMYKIIHTICNMFNFFMI